MMAWTHAVIGAAVGSQAPTPEAALTAGIVSHGLADLFPHRDYDMKVEVPLLAIVLAIIGIRYGLKSREFWGAVGGFSPDIENGFEMLGLTNGTVFPTHTRNSWFVGHGRMIKSVLPQIAIGIVCLWIAENSRKA